MIDLFDSKLVGGTVLLKNRIVMAPMTRTRTSEGDVPNELMAAYYGQRASAGLIITEATDVAPTSNGYAMTPAIYTAAQRQGWRLVTDEVHRNGGTIFAQLWHVGRMAHASLMPNGDAPLGVTEERADSQVFAHGPDGVLGYMPAGAPRRLRADEVFGLVGTFTQACVQAREAGFDGVEIHGANGYLIEQFMNSVLNTRSDCFGGASVENRTRFLLDVVEAAVRELGPGRVGVRLSPFGRFNGIPADPRTEETLLYVAEQLGRLGVAYLHLVYELMQIGEHGSGRIQIEPSRPRFAGQGPGDVSRCDHLVRWLH
jgi:N-ethylmaleimide reductase